MNRFEVNYIKLTYLKLLKYVPLKNSNIALNTYNIFIYCYRLNVCFPKFICWNLVTYAMALEVGLWEMLGHESGVLMNAVGTPLKETPESALASSS